MRARERRWCARSERVADLSCLLLNPYILYLTPVLAYSSSSTTGGGGQQRLFEGAWLLFLVVALSLSVYSLLALSVLLCCCCVAVVVTCLLGFKTLTKLSMPASSVPGDGGVLTVSDDNSCSHASLTARESSLSEVGVLLLLYVFRLLLLFACCFGHRCGDWLRSIFGCTLYVLYICVWYVCNFVIFASSSS